MRRSSCRKFIETDKVSESHWKSVIFCRPERVNTQQVVEPNHDDRKQSESSPESSNSILSLSGPSCRSCSSATCLNWAMISDRILIILLFAHFLGKFYCCKQPKRYVS